MICSGRRPPCTSVTVVVELKQNSRCLFCSPPLPSPPLCLCQLHMTANSPNLPPSRVYTLTGWDSKHYYSFTLCKMQHVKLTWSGPVSGKKNIHHTDINNMKPFNENTQFITSRNANPGIESFHRVIEPLPFPHYNSICFIQPS